MWASRVLRMAVKKTTTGIVGLPVNPNARQDLIAIYQKTLQAIQVRLLRPYDRPFVRPTRP